MQLGEDGFHAGRPDDFGGYLAVDKVEQGGDGLDREPQAEIGIVIHIDFDNPWQFLCTGRQLRPAPVRFCRKAGSREPRS